MFILVGGNVWLHFFLSLITPACPTFLYLLASIYIASETSTYCLCVDIVLPLCRVQKNQLWVISSFANHAEIAEKIKFRNRVHAEKTTLWILKVRRQLISFLVFLPGPSENAFDQTFWSCSGRMFKPLNSLFLIVCHILLPKWTQSTMYLVLPVIYYLPLFANRIR